jgi:hypothetical protein
MIVFLAPGMTSVSLWGQGSGKIKKSQKINLFFDFFLSFLCDPNPKGEMVSLEKIKKMQTFSYANITKPSNCIADNL